jgi:hypothetical protein
VEINAFLFGQRTVRFVFLFFLTDFFLIRNKFLGFLLGQFAGFDALLNAILLIILSRINAGIMDSRLSRLSGSYSGLSFGIMLFLVDLFAGRVQILVKINSFILGERSIRFVLGFFLSDILLRRTDFFGFLFGEVDRILRLVGYDLFDCPAER